MPSPGCVSIHSHTMYIYKSRADRLQAFLQLCQCTEERVFYLFLLDSRSLETARYLFGRLGIAEVERASKFVSAEQFYTHRADLSRHILELFEETYTEALDHEFSVLHIMVDMGFLLSFVHKEEVLSVERRLDGFYQHHRAKGMCIYFYENLSAELIEPLKREHNEIHLSDSLLYSHLDIDPSLQRLAQSEALDETIADLFLARAGSWDYLRSEPREGDHRLRFPPFLSLLNHVIWIVDQSLTISYVSPTVEEVLGYSPRRYIGRHTREFVDPESYERLDLSLQEVSEEALRSPEKRVYKRFYSSLTDSEGRTREMEHVVYPMLLQGKIIGFAGTSRPGSPIETLVTFSSHSLQQRWKTVWNSLPLGLVLTDAEGRVQFINSFFASLTGFGSSQNLPRFEQMACWPEPEAIPADTEPDTASAGTVEDRNHASGSGKTAITTVHGQQIEVGITLLPIQSVYQSELRLYFIVPETLGDPQEVVSWLEGMQRVNEGVRLRLEDLQKERGLTLREMQVIEQVMEGLQNKEIADQLHVAEITVKKHLTRIFGKCGVQSRFELARFVNRFSIESGMGRPRGGQGGRHEEYTE